MRDLAQTLYSMNSAQLVAAFIFLASYALSLGGLPSTRGRAWGLGVAGVSALTFMVLTRPWEHGPMLVAIAMGSIATFIVIVSLFSAIFGLSRQRAATQNTDLPATEPDKPAPQPKLSTPARAR